MAKKYLDYDGLAYFWEKIKNRIIGKIDDVNYDNTNKKLTKTKEGVTTDIVSVATLKTDMALKKADVGLANVVDGAQVNVLQGIQKNGTTVSITNKIANITVPTKTSDITNDSGFITSADVPEGAVASTTTPKMNGTAAVGTQTAFARGDHVHPVDTSRAPINHASTAATYGAGSDTNYGHVKLSDATDGTATAATGGIAASPKAVADALQAAKDYADSLDTGVTGVRGSAESTYRTGNVELSYTNVGAAASSHAHGFITNAGRLETDSQATIEDGNRLVFVDSQSRIRKSSIIFNSEATGAAYTFLDKAGNFSTAVIGVKGTAETGNYRTGQVSISAANVGAAPTSHASTATTYGVGSTTNYGHVKVTNGNGLGISNGTISMNIAKTTAAGAMSAADKTKLDGAAPLASPALTGTPTAPTATAGTNSTQIATTAFVTSAIQTAQTGAASFQGTAPTTFAPTNYKKGYYWVVGTAGTYAGETCEPGDMIFAVADYDSAYKAADFNVIQTNLDITSITNAEIDTIVAS